MLGSLYYHYSRFGLAGLKAAFSHRVLGCSPVLEVSHPDIKFPVHLRIGTSDVPTFEQVFLNKEYQFTALVEPSVIMDAGANIGLASVLFASRYPQARIIAIEPEPGNYTMLEKNTSPYANITRVKAALWNKNDQINLVDSGSGNWGFMTHEANNTDAHSTDKLTPATFSSVRALTISQVLREQGLNKIDILKLDIEGAEREVFDNADQWIDQVQSVIVELHDNMKPGCSDSFELISGAFTHRWNRGENIYVSRPGVIATA